MTSTITPQELQSLADYVFRVSGIQLDQSKGYLLESRLQPVLNANGLSDFRELHERAILDRSGTLEKAIIDAISTNETFFFRDKVPFVLLRHKIIPELIDRKRHQNPGSPVSLKVWSAASSTGQEIYSIAITILEMFPKQSGYNITLLGSDISNKAIAQASYGKYNHFEVTRGLEAKQQARYFTRLADGWRVKDNVRALVRFEQRNLLHPFTGIGPFDIIFCRNVAIYFSTADKIKIFKKLAQVLTPDGALIVGGSESLTGLALDFVPQYYLGGIYYVLAPLKETQAVPKEPYVSPRPLDVAKRPKRSRRSLHPPLSEGVTQERQSSRLEKTSRRRGASCKEENKQKLPSSATAVTQTSPPNPTSFQNKLQQGTCSQKALLSSLAGKEQTGKDLLGEVHRTQQAGARGVLARIKQENKDGDGTGS